MLLLFTDGIWRIKTGGCDGQASPNRFFFPSEADTSSLSPAGSVKSSPSYPYNLFDTFHCPQFLDKHVQLGVVIKQNNQIT